MGKELSRTVNRGVHEVFAGGVFCFRKLLKNGEEIIKNTEFPHS
jgi:hypothetical protein